MRCPIDETELRISDRQGIEIDYCPQCRGVWLDRGELDKLIERNAQAPAPIPDRAAAPLRDADRDRDRDYRDGDRDRDRDRDRGYRDERDYREPARGDYPPQRRRRSFLDDIFDFD